MRERRKVSCGPAAVVWQRRGQEVVACAARPAQLRAPARPCAAAIPSPQLAACSRPPAAAGYSCRPPTQLARTLPPKPPTFSAFLWRLMAWYMMGCVNMGSSISLCLRVSQSVSQWLVVVFRGAA